MLGFMPCSSTAPSKLKSTPHVKPRCLFSTSSVLQPEVYLGLASPRRCRVTHAPHMHDPAAIMIKCAASSKLDGAPSTI